MRVLVTGGAGFIGSHVADGFLKEGYEVDILDNLSTGQERNIPKDAKFYQEDISNPVIGVVLKERKYSILCHLAAQIDVRRSVADPVFDVNVNVIGTINLLLQCLQYGIDYVIFSSTGGAIYGEQEYFPADELHPTNPDSPYGINKLTAEKYLNFLFKSFKLPYAALRYTNVYGPRQNPKGEAGVVSIFLDRLLRGEKAIMFGDGTQTRDYVFVHDVVRANLLAAEKRPVGVMNISTGIETDVNSIYRHLADALASSEEPEHAPPRKGEQKRSVCSWNKAQELLGWKPATSLFEGIPVTTGYFKELFEREE